MKNKLRQIQLVVILVVLILPILYCGNPPETLESQGYSNILLFENKLWFGAGYKLYTVDLDNPTARIYFDTNDVLISFVAIDDNRIYFGGTQYPSEDGSIIWAMNIKTKELIWKHEFPYDWFGGGFIVTSPLINDRMFIIATATTLWGLDKNSGSAIWSKEGSYGNEQILPFLYEDNIIFGSGYYDIVIANAYSGSELRKYTLTDITGGSPTVYKNCLLVKDHKNYQENSAGELEPINLLRLNCLDIESGKVIWTIEQHGVIMVSNIAYFNNQIYDSFKTRLFAIDVANGQILWQSGSMSAGIKNPQIIADMNLIAVETPSQKKIEFIDLVSGKASQLVMTDVLSAPIFFNKRVVFGSNDRIICMDLSLDEIIWSLPVDSKFQYYYDY